MLSSALLSLQVLEDVCGVLNVI